MKEQEEKAQKLKNDKSRFVFCKETLKEFNLKEREVPFQNREDVEGFTNHVNENVRLMENYNAMNKAEYMSRMKLNCET